MTAKAGDEFDMNVDITGPISGHFTDWPSFVQDKIYTAIEEQVECPPNHKRVIIQSYCQQDPDPPFRWFLFVRVAIWPNHMMNQ